jgi:hypothetical protein
MRAQLLLKRYADLFWFTPNHLARPRWFAAVKYEREGIWDAYRAFDRETGTAFRQIPYDAINHGPPVGETDTARFISSLSRLFAKLGHRRIVSRARL